MSVKALQDYTYTSKYARYLPEKKRRETWTESVERVRDMHIRKYPQIQEEITWAFDQVKQKRVLGSQRALQFGGAPIEKKNARLYNCTASYCDRIRFFQECFWLLLCGCGTGFSVQRHHIEKIKGFSGSWLSIPEEKLNQKSVKNRVYVVPDSIEGWGDALGVLMSSFLGEGDFPDFEGYWVQFDYSLIRPEGESLGSSSGKAPGPKPLQNAIEKIRTLCLECIRNKQTKLEPINAYDIVMHASDAVLSGGVRRSATICVFSPDDEKMAQAKTGNWFTENPQRGRSNNSALLLRNETTKEEFDKLMSYVRGFGEPGFIWADSREVIFNPCVEISLYAHDPITNQTGWHFCNLCEINGKYCDSQGKFETAARAAAIIGTCQAGYTDFSYLGEATQNIVKKEALLGVSITGMMDNPEILFDKEIQNNTAKLILEVNAEIAAKIGINPTARATCVKPAGTTSCILGTASGIHPHHAKRYIRRSQANYLEPPLQHFKKVNPIAVEKSVWSANGTDEVIAFCIEVPKGAKTKNDLNAIDLLEHVKSTQQNWVLSGTVKERCAADFLNHNVSNTISVKDDEWEAVADFIYDNREWFAGISLLPISGDKDYPQAPFTAIYTPSEIAKMYGDGSVMASGLIVDGLRAFDNNLWKACDAVVGNGEPIQPPTCTNNMNIDSAVDFQNKMAAYESKLDWIRRAVQFAERYFEGNIKKMTHCLKDVANWKYWCDLQREYKHVEYVTMIEEEDNTKLEQTIACAGGTCELQM